MSLPGANGGPTSPGDPGASTPGGSDGVARRPIGVILASAVGGFRNLARQHAELAKIESSEAASSRAQGAGMMAAAAVLVLYALGFGAAAGAVGLAIVLPTWAAVLIVGAVFAAAAGVVFLTGRKAMRTAPKVEQTRETLKEDVRWAKHQQAG